jgi:hypothetical protein
MIQIMIAGAQKSGTSSLKYYLGQHPDVHTHERNEIVFFIHDPEYSHGYQEAYPRYFESKPSDNALILAKSAGIMYLPEAVKRLWEHNPAVRIIVCLRNPVDRAYSAYWYARRKGWENLDSFEEGLRAEPARVREDLKKWRQCAYLDRGLYYDQIVRLWERFGKEQVRILFLEDLHRDPVGSCQTLFAWLGIDAGFTPLNRERVNRAATVRSAWLAQLMVSSKAITEVLGPLIPSEVRFFIKDRIKQVNEKGFLPPPMHPETRVRLQKYFEPFNAELSRIVGRDLSHWDRS